ncbi:MAG: hypothetical protein U0792_02875 [Gemmataceae bacterium]
MIVSRVAAALPRRWVWLFRLFRWYSRRYVRKHFHAVRLSKSGHNFPPSDHEPLLIVLNHPAWWDPMICMVLSWLIAEERDQFAAIDAEAVKRYAGVQEDGVHSGGHAKPPWGGRVRSDGTTILSQSDRVYWVTAPGRFTDVRERPLAISLQASVIWLRGSLPEACCRLHSNTVSGQNAHPRRSCGSVYRCE